MDRKELLDSLLKCGHFLHDQKGKKLGQYRILLFLKNHQQVSQMELQHFLRVQAGSISEILLKMEKAGLVSRCKDSLDKRRILINLTDLGLKKVNELILEYEEENEHLFDCLNDSECVELKDILDRLYEKWVK